MKDIQLSQTDRQILNALANNGRMPYKELAALVGLPVSTCHGRVRALEDAGVIRGYRADIAPSAAGAEIHALISITVRGSHRDSVPAVTEKLRGIPGVQTVYLIGGDRDLVMHVACATVGALRDLIAEHLGSDPTLDQTRTQIVFDHVRGTRPAG